MGLVSNDDGNDDDGGGSFSGDDGGDALGCRGSDLASPASPATSRSPVLDQGIRATLNAELQALQPQLLRYFEEMSRVWGEDGYIQVRRILLALALE